MKRDRKRELGKRKKKEDDKEKGASKLKTPGVYFNND